MIQFRETWSEDFHSMVIFMSGSFANTKIKLKSILNEFYQMKLSHRLTYPSFWANHRMVGGACTKYGANFINKFSGGVM